MLSIEQARKLALAEKKGLVITNAVKYKNYYVFFMQPKGVDPYSEDALLDSYVFVNFKSEKIEYRSLAAIDDFVENASPLPV